MNSSHNESTAPFLENWDRRYNDDEQSTFLVCYSDHKASDENNISFTFGKFFNTSLLHVSPGKSFLLQTSRPSTNRDEQVVDNRKWTPQHLTAADLPVTGVTSKVDTPLTELTPPPQLDLNADVNARGPGLQFFVENSCHLHLHFTISIFQSP